MLHALVQWARGKAAKASTSVGAVISSGGTAIAKAAEPTVGTAGYWLMSVTSLFATSGATNGGCTRRRGCASN